MANEKPPVPPTGSPTGDAGTQDPVKPNPAAPDYLAELHARDEKMAKLQQDRDNYRSGMLKYKKLAEQNPGDSSLTEEQVKQMIREENINSELAQVAREKDAIIQKIAKENAEMRTAMLNKQQVSNLPGGSSQPGDDFKPEVLTPEQKAYFQEVAGQTGVSAETLEKQFLANWKKKQQQK